MRVDTYNEIVNFVRNPSLHLACINSLCSKYPQFSRATLTSILSLETQRKSKKKLFLQSSPESSMALYNKYKNTANKKNDLILKMAIEIDLSPCLLARIILEKHFPNSTKKRLSSLMKDPQLIDDVVLQKNVTTCIYADKIYGPVADLVSRSAGHEHEVILRRKLMSHNIPFHDECYLRTRGYDKTPDVVLQVPIAVNNKVINWIESKALFADLRCHQKYLEDQYSPYLNRFGAGLVVYWLGFTEDIEASSDLSIVDKFPDDFTTLKITFS